MSCRMTSDRIESRRRWLKQSAIGAAGCSSSGWLGQLAAHASNTDSQPKRSCIVLWMNGGPSQTDTFDMKPDHENGGPFKSIQSKVPGIAMSEHLAGISNWSDRLSIIRSMTTKEGDHGRARQHLRTGYTAQGSIQFPVLGSLVANEHAHVDSDLPNYVSILPSGLFNPGIPAAGFLGPGQSPLLVDSDGGNVLAVKNLSLPDGISEKQITDRNQLRKKLESQFLANRIGDSANAHQIAYERASRLMTASASSAFDLMEEPESVRSRYGSNRFGQGCLLARRLVEREVPFVEVTLGGWDTHDNNFESVKNLCSPLDQAWSALMQDLEDRGRLDSTLVVWMGEFGRTPGINPRNGRDHYPKAWSVVLGGGGIQGGSVVGKTGADGMEVEDRPVTTPDLLATICLALGLDPMKQNMSNVDRPIRMVDPEAKPVHEILV